MQEKPGLYWPGFFIGAKCMALFIDPTSEVGQYISKLNRARQFDFVVMSVNIANHGVGLEIDHDFICNLNRYATQYISQQCGKYRRHYDVKVAGHLGTDWFLIQQHMEEFLGVLHQNWAIWNEMQTAAYALWGVCHVHPFWDGNGRTARALCYFVLCRKLGLLPRGRIAFIELIKEAEHDRYCQILQRMHEAKQPDMTTDLQEMALFLDEMLLKQVTTADVN